MQHEAAMQTLSYGFLKPGTGDRGSTFWAALAANIQQMNDHSHNGVNSVKLTSLSSTAYLQTVASASWVATSNGLYSQTVTVPGGGNYDDYNITFRDFTTGHQYLLQVEKVSATTYNVFINDSSKSLKAAYT